MKFTDLKQRGLEAKLAAATLEREAELWSDLEAALGRKIRKVVVLWETPGQLETYFGLLVDGESVVEFERLRQTKDLAELSVVTAAEYRHGLSQGPSRDFFDFALTA